MLPLTTAYGSSHNLIKNKAYSKDNCEALIAA